MKQKGSHSVHSRRRRLYARRVVIVVVAVLLVVGLLAGVGYLILPKYRYKPVPDAASDLGIDETDVQFDKKIINVALFGYLHGAFGLRDDPQPEYRDQAG